MTQRIVWLMGVAAVATMVILAGCGDGPGAAPTEPTDPPPATNYVTALAGTWNTTVTTMVPGDDPNAPPAEVQNAVTATVTAGDMVNMGTLELVVVPTVAMQPGPPITVSGTIEVDAAEITVTITGVVPEPTGQQAQILAGLLATPQTLTYTLSEDGSMLTVGNATLLPILVGSASITLTKEMASS